MSFDLIKQLDSVFNEKLLMFFFDPLLLLYFNLSISHYDLIAQPVKRPNLLTQRRFLNSSIWRLIKALVGVCFDVRRYELLS
mgnify:CR=1 FL=1